MEEGQERHDDVPLAEALPVPHALALAQVGDQIAVGQHDALGQARGPARIRERDQVLSRVDARGRWLRARLEELGEGRGAFRRPEDKDLLHHALLRRLLRLVEEGRHRHQEPGARVRELLGELVSRVQRIRRRVDAAEGRHGEEDHGILGHVGAVDREDVALLESPLGQACRGPPHAVRELRIRQGTTRRRVDESRLVAEPRGMAQDVVGDGHLGDTHVRARALHGHGGLLGEWSARVRRMPPPADPARAGAIGQIGPWIRQPSSCEAAGADPARRPPGSETWDLRRPS